MKRAFLMLALLGLGACTSSGYPTATMVYAEPVEYVYVAPVDQVVVVSRQALVSNGYTVYRVTSHRSLSLDRRCSLDRFAGLHAGVPYRARSERQSRLCSYYGLAVDPKRPVTQRPCMSRLNVPRRR